MKEKGEKFFMKKLIHSIITVVSPLASFLLTMAVNSIYENNNFNNVKDENCLCYTEDMPERILTIIARTNLLF